MSLTFDLLLGVALLWSAWHTLATADLIRAVVSFIVFGLLMVLAWARLDAPDIALAEAAIGAGLTGALLLDSVGHLRAGGRPPGRERMNRALRTAVYPGAGLLAALLVVEILALPDPVVRLPAQVATQLPTSGVTHPVTAVLLNFRGYDTLLEVAVLVLALVGLLAQSPPRELTHAPSPDEPVLPLLARVLVPFLLLSAGYLLWAGAHRPGGAFQAGAVLAAAAVVLHLARLWPAWDRPGRGLRLGLVSGLLLFLAVAAALLAGGTLLRFPPQLAGTLILLIEIGLTVSLGLLLAGLFLFLAEPRSP